jgi:hypothetical protein
MATIQERILEQFCQALGKSDEFSETMLGKLRALLGAGGKARAADVVKALSGSAKEQVP